MHNGPRAKEEGRLRYHLRFESRYLSTSRNLIVYVPPGYDESDWRCPVLYLQDGQNLFDPATAFAGMDWRVDMTADHLIRSGNIPPLIIVGIYNTGVRRLSEYTPTRDEIRRKGGKADRYAQMLAREVKPFIDRQYRTVRGTEYTGIGGSSLGALVSIEAALLYPKVFGAVAALSPSVWWDRRVIVDMVKDYSGAQRPRIWLDMGTREGDQPEVMIGDVRFLRDTLVARGWQPGSTLSYHEAEGAEHNEYAWAGRMGAVLQYLFGGLPLTSGQR